MSLLGQLATTVAVIIATSIAINIVKQTFFKDSRKPPVVWHWLPLLGSTVDYGQDPYAFFFRCREKYGDTFTFGLLGMKVTVYLGTQGNNFILNGKLKDLNAEEVYGPLTIPVFGKGVVYDLDNARFMDQKRLVKEGFTSANLRAYVPKFVQEVESYIATNPAFQSSSGICDISSVISEIALYCAAASLQGSEVRAALNGDMATLYRHLDDGFAPINFMLPGLPIPVNRRRDHAQRAMQKLYMDIITRRRATAKPPSDADQDMLWALMSATYKDGTSLTDPETANLMIALLMGGQHNTAASGTWIMLELAHRPHLIHELFLEQEKTLGSRPPNYSDINSLVLHNAVIKETLRLHSPIHSIMRKVKSPMPIPGTEMVVPAGHVLLAAPSFPSRLSEYFPNPEEWDPKRWLRSDPSASSSPSFGETIDYGYGPVAINSALSPYLPFGAGRHRCVGETFAYAQLTTMLVTLVRSLEWEQVDPNAKVPKTDYSSMFSRPMHPATIRWKKRATIL